MAKNRCHVDLPALGYASAARLLPHVFSQPCKSSVRLKPLCALSSSSSSSPQPSFPEAGGLDWSAVPQPGAGDPLASRAGWTWPECESPLHGEGQLSIPEHNSVPNPDSSPSRLIQHDRRRYLEPGGHLWPLWTAALILWTRKRGKLRSSRTILELDDLW